MMKKNFSWIAIVLSVLIFSACTGQKGDMTKDPKYADIANNIFITKEPLYYYHYTHSDGGKSGYFLSAENSMPNAELKSEIPVGGHVKISKVLEVPQQDGNVQVMVQGEVINAGQAGMEYMAIYEDIKPALRINE
ncbi:hypothetical protein [Sphingobacterium sp.]|uniref:hypothetical protein n=1 Tax=Sphingobacterium sp. TaxID=341027 RepID=UPI0028AC2E3D|nr:hypothetical protein [Sphingobacterium sp.]